MDLLNEHPDDATLFDLIEGELEETHAQRIEAHLDACATCGDFVRAALAGSPDDGAPIEPMPGLAADRMHVALAGAWRERIATIAAQEAAQDAAGWEPQAILTAPLEPATTPPRRGRTRRLVPVLAFVVLATLAGTSLQVGRDEPTSSSDGASAGAPSAKSTDDFSSGAELDMGATESAAPSAGAAATAESGAGAATGGPEAEATQRLGGAQAQDDGRGTATQAPVPPVGYEEYVEVEETCIATFDQSALMLPDGRTPQRIVPGPFGSYVVCG